MFKLRSIHHTMGILWPRPNLGSFGPLGYLGVYIFVAPDSWKLLFRFVDETPPPGSDPQQVEDSGCPPTGNRARDKQFETEIHPVSE